MRLFRKHIILCLSGLVMLLNLTAKVYSQNSLRFTQYMFNELSVNPSYAGTNQALNANLIYRDQWAGTEGAPNTQLFTIESPVYGKKIGLGAMIFKESIGIQKDYGAMLSYAYRLKFHHSNLSLGLQGGFINKTVRWDELRLVDPDDETFPDGAFNVWVPNFGFGAYYYGRQFYLGLSAPRILVNEIPIDNTAEEYFALSLSKIHYYFTGAYVFILNNDFAIKASGLAKMVRDASNQYDLNLTFFIKYGISFGTGFHSGDSYVVMAGYRISDQLALHYSYDITYSNLRHNKPTTHEFVLSYKISRNHQIIVSPRYF